MGTSGAYTGAGGRAGKEVAEGLGDWLGSLSVGSGDGGDRPNTDPSGEAEKPVTQLPPKLVSGLLGLMGPGGTTGGAERGITTGRGSASGGSSRTRAGSGRSSRRLASVAGRAAAGAYAYVRSDVAELRSLGLDYDELRGMDDPLEVMRQVVDAVCGQQGDGRLEETEERYVAASVATWVLEQSESEQLPDVDDVARYALATVMAEIVSAELSVALRDQRDGVAAVAEDELLASTMILARQAELNPSGPTAHELTRAIEGGIQKLREIYGG